MRMLPALAAALSAVLAVPTALLLALGPGGLLPTAGSDVFAGVGGASFLLLALAFAAVGAIVAQRVPGNRVGSVFVATGFVTVLQLLTWQYADVGLHTGHDLPGADAAAVVNNLIGEATAGSLGLSALLFPDGRLPSRRWRPALGSLAAGMALLVVAGAFTPGAYDAPFAEVANPLGLAGTRGTMDALDGAGWVLVVVGIGAAAASLVARLRRAHGVERRQLKLVLAVGSVAASAAGLLMATWLVWPSGGLAGRIAALGLALVAFPIAAGFAILRRGLYGIDVVINRTLIYVPLSLLLTATFAATTILLGTAVGRRSPWATAAATLVVAVAFRPLRARLQDAVDRRFSRTRYDALRRMAAYLHDLRAGRAAPEALEELLRELLEDPGLELRYFLPQTGLCVDARGVPAAAGPGEGQTTVLIERGGEPLAAVLHRHGGNRSALLRQLVDAGGFALEIARLGVALGRQLAEVEASRLRIVAAANEERRRIERDLHDGAQQRLVGIGLALRHAQHELGSAPATRIEATLERAVDEVAVAIDELRELARGLPPSQLDAGLAPAFHELARRAPVRVEVIAPSERFDRQVEAAAYFIGCEGLTNAVKHARATRVALTAARRAGQLVVTVCDDGVGGAAAMPGSGLAGLSDRVAALGGTLRLESDPGAGTTLTAELPCAS